MSFKTKEEAVARANAVLAMMKQTGWKKRVHYNMGWHFSILHKSVSLSVNEHKYPGKRYTYSAMLGLADSPGSGCGIWTSSRDPWFYNPNKAVEHAVRQARLHLTPYITAVKLAEQVMDYTKAESPADIQKLTNAKVDEAIRALRRMKISHVTRVKINNRKRRSLK